MHTSAACERHGAGLANGCTRQAAPRDLSAGRLAVGSLWWLQTEDTMPWLFLLVSLIGAWLTYNAYQPIYAPARRAAVSFFTGWLTTELALHHIAWQAVMTRVFMRAGALHAWPGRLGLLITCASWIGLWRRYARGRDAEVVVGQALRPGLGPGYQEEMVPGMQ